MVYVVDDAVVVGDFSRTASFGKADGTVSARLPGLTVVKACDQQVSTNAARH